MADLDIPVQYQAGFRRLIEADDSDIESLLSALRSAEPKLGVQALAAELSKTSTVRRSALIEILDTVSALFFMWDQSDEEVAPIIDSVCESLFAEPSFQRLSEPEKARLKLRLEKLLALEGVLWVTAKAKDVLTDHQHVFLEGRVLTDLRPVYGTDTSKPVAGTVIHTLKIIYYENFQKKEFFVTLDVRDIKILRKLLDRADQKTDSLKKIWEQSAIPYLHLDDEE